MELINRRAPLLRRTSIDLLFLSMKTAWNEKFMDRALRPQWTRGPFLLTSIFHLGLSSFLAFSWSRLRSFAPPSVETGDESNPRALTFPGSRSLYIAIYRLFFEVAAISSAGLDCTSLFSINFISFWCQHVCFKKSGNELIAVKEFCSTAASAIEWVAALNGLGEREVDNPRSGKLSLFGWSIYPHSRLE